MFKDKLIELDVCKEAVEWVGDRTFEEAFLDCPRGDWMLWFYAKVYPENKRELSLAKGLCANTARHLMSDERSVAAVDAAIAYGRGEITDEELRTAAEAAEAAYYAIRHANIISTTVSSYAAASCTAAYASYAAACANGADYLSDATAVAYAAASTAYYVSPTTDAADAARKENQLATANICREVFRNETGE